MNVGLAAAAFFLGLVSRSGAIGGAVLGTVIYASVGWQGFAVLFVFFAVGSALSKLGYRRKAALGVAQENRGRRGARHALANCLTSVVCAVIYGWTGEPLWLIAYCAAFATALSDTTASEVGQLYGKHPFLPTTLRRVPVGTEGAISVEGTLAGAVAAIGLGFLSVVLLAPLDAMDGVWIGCGGFAGMMLESILGASSPMFRRAGNEVMNFANTVIGAGVAVLLAW
ncbi:MAG: DUF92 domain-containing protein [Planctomycetota bacterium]